MNIHHLLAYLQVNDAARAIESHTSVYGATEKFRLTDPNGRIGHAVGRGTNGLGLSRRETAGGRR